MDLASIIGILGSFIIVLGAIMVGGPLSMFADMASVLIVVVGSTFVVMYKFSLQQFTGAFKVAIKAFIVKVPNADALIEEVLEVSRIARKEGLLALDGRDSTSPFFKMGLQLIVDGQPPETVRAILEKERFLTLDRHRWGAKVFSAFADVAPAMGMIGTLVGLVQMLANMSDPKAIGPAMAVALLTTLYGAVMAFMVFGPMSDKLTLRMSEEAKLNAMLIDALTSIQGGTNPRVVEQMMNAYLPPAKRKAES